MKILITGVAGAIGSHLAERLLNEGHQVVGIDALTPYYNPEIKKINIRDIESLGGDVHIIDLVHDNFDHLLNGVDVIFHLAAQPGISKTTVFEDYLKNNFIATNNLIQKAKEVSSLKGFIHASTSSVYGAFANGDEQSEPKPTSNYGVTKLAAEQLVLSYFRDIGFPATVLRFFSVYGERERPEKLYHKLIKAIHDEVEFPIFDGSRGHVRSFTYVQDIIDGCILVLKNLERVQGEIFNLGNDKAMTTGEGIDLIEKLIGKKAKFVVLPKRQGDQKETAANISKIRKMLGYNPSTSLEEGLRRQVDWYKNKIHGKIK